MQPGSQTKEDLKKMELLAPAGGMEAFKAAVENGADAVYLGGKLFSARASAANFDLEELERAVAYAHERQVKIYVTVNILAADQEFYELADYLYRLYTLGVDALIVQDIGVAHFIRTVLPEMTLHASTQMTQNNLFGLKQLEKNGFSRVVLARETTKAEIETIVKATPLAIEVFVHGALCVCYSGQCLMSSYIGARSGNRGKCAQPCRLPYQLVDEKGQDLLAQFKVGDHLLSPRDLNLSENLAELQQIGVNSLKIEGRMKRPEYVATVVRIYSKALADLSGAQEGLKDQDRYELNQIFNRDFTTGYLHGVQGSEMMSYTRPNNRGTRAARIQEVKPNRLILKLENALRTGDGLEIWTSRGREGVTVGKIFPAAGGSVETAASGEIVGIEFTGSARAGDRVFKTHDQELIEKARLSFQEGKEQRKRPLRMKLSGEAGGKLYLEVWENSQSVVTESQSCAQEALHRPLEAEYLAKQLGRLGNTPFFLDELRVELQGPIIIPVSELNEMRRAAVERLLASATKKSVLKSKEYQDRLLDWQRRSVNPEQGKKTSRQTAPKFQLSVSLTDPSLVAPVIKAGATRVILGGEHWRFGPAISLERLQDAARSCREKGVEPVWRLPRIINEEQSHKLYNELKEIAKWKVKPTIMIGNLAGVEMMQSLNAQDWPWETDHFLPVFNQAALMWLAEAGSRRATLSTELNYEQIAAMIKPVETEMLVFGDMEMMVSEFCLMGATLCQEKGNPREKCGRVCQKGRYYLKDRLAYHFPLETDRECRMHIFNAKRLNLLADLVKIADAGVADIRLELLRASAQQILPTVNIFNELWTDIASGKIIKPDRIEEMAKQLEKLYPEGFTKGHFYRGVLT